MQSRVKENFLCCQYSGNLVNALIPLIPNKQPKLTKKNYISPGLIKRCYLQHKNSRNLISNYFIYFFKNCNVQITLPIENVYLFETMLLVNTLLLNFIYFNIGYTKEKIFWYCLVPAPTLHTLSYVNYLGISIL